MKKTLTVAASILLIISIGLSMKDKTVNQYINPIVEVIYPKHMPLMIMIVGEK